MADLELPLLACALASLVGVAFYPVGTWVWFALVGLHVVGIVGWVLVAIDLES